MKGGGGGGGGGVGGHLGTLPSGARSLATSPLAHTPTSPPPPHLLLHPLEAFFTTGP